MIPKPAKTAADYLAIAVCPALIMVLVGSLVFFLVQVGFAGERIGMIRWTLFWFVFAMVLVSRIAIEQSSGAAFVYGLVLALATSAMLTRYIGFLWGVWLLLSLIWWASNKIVWDCTFIDDDQDASGQGLLQVSGIDRWRRRQLAQVRAVPSEESDPAGTRPSHPLQSTETRTPVLPGAFQQGLPPSARRAATAGRNARATQSRQKPQVLHAPGLWVLYFSFAAVPVFGLGELLLNTNDAVGRRACFGWLVAYLAAALCLLFLTSFLGLRRYLRQKYLIMPRAMAGAWVATGLALTVSALVLALLLPRPATPYSLAALVTKLTVLPQEASRYAPQRSEGGEGQSRSRADGQQGEKAPDAAAGAEQQRPERLDNRGQPSGGSGSGSQSQGIKSPVSPPAVSFPLARWIPYLVAAAVAVFALVRFWPEISAGFRSFLGLLSKPRRKEKKTLPKPRSSSSGEGEAVRLLPNPFHTGQASRMSLSELVQYSYEGLTLWAKARGFALDPSETPIELAERLSQKEPALTHEILLLSSYYSHVTYGNQPPPEECLTVLKSLWSIIGFGPAR